MDKLNREMDEQLEQRVADLTAQGGCVACVVDLKQEWHRGA